MHALLVLYPMKTMEMLMCVCSVSTGWWWEGVCGVVRELVQCT